MVTELTEYEAAFVRLEPGQRVTVRRERRYDPEYGLLHMPGVRCATVVANGPTSCPDREWVREGLRRGVVGDEARSIPYRHPPSMPGAGRKRRIEIGAFPLDRYVETCEEELVFGGLVDNLIGDASRPAADRLQSILAERSLGNTANRRNVDPSILAGRMERSLAQQAPIQFVLPAMPFKDQCAFRTEAPADHVDLGEVAFLVRLHCLVLAANQIHPYDAECVVVSDGTAYAPMFDIPTAAAVRYVETLREIRDHLNLAKSIHIVHLKDLVDLDTEHSLTGSGKSIVEVRRTIRRHLGQLVKRDTACARSMSVLAYGMRWNLNTRALLDEASPARLWKAMRRQGSRSTDDRELVDLASRISNRAMRAAIDYLSFNLAVNYCGLFDRYFPDAIRLTSHPKVGQVAAPRLGSVYPWNGVAVSTEFDSDRVRANSISSIELHSALREGLVPVYRHGETYPICYTTPTKV